MMSFWKHVLPVKHQRRVFYVGDSSKLFHTCVECRGAFQIAPAEVDLAGGVTRQAFLKSNVVPSLGREERTDTTTPLSRHARRSYS